VKYAWDSSKGGVKLEGPWQAWLDSIDPKKFEERLHAEVRKATLRNALIVKKEILRLIQQGNAYEPNSPLTLAIKAPRTKPLVHGGDLFQAITTKLVDDFTAFVGLNRKTAGDKAVNIAIVLHEGATIPKQGDVTQAMRAAVFARARENKAGADHLQKITDSGQPAKKKWVIKPRPFIRKAIEKPSIQAQLQRNWSLAIGRALGVLT
jgi:hypothetical protein